MTEQELNAAIDKRVGVILMETIGALKELIGPVLAAHTDYEQSTTELATECALALSGAKDVKKSVLIEKLRRLADDGKKFIAARREARELVKKFGGGA